MLSSRIKDIIYSKRPFPAVAPGPLTMLLHGAHENVVPPLFGSFEARADVPETQRHFPPAGRN